MRKAIILFTAVVLIISGCTNFSSTPVKLADLPNDVEYTIVDRTEGFIIDRIEYQVKDSSKSYLVTYIDGGVEKQFRVDPNGQVIE